MKYFVLLCDGIADRPRPELGNKTILESANIPNMHALAKNGVCGKIKTTPDGMYPGSDICNLSIFGYDPRKYYTGRSPLEAANMGIDIGKNDLTLRCNLVTLKNGVMDSFSAHHVKNEHAKNVIKRLNELFYGENFKFYQGVSYRHILSMQNVDFELKTTPPHDITDKEFAPYLPQGKGSDILNKIMSKAASVFDGSIETGDANAIWLWGEGKKPAMPLYKDLYGLSGAVISAVDLLRGIGRCAGLEVIQVPGMTGFLDTNFEGKAEYAIKALEKHDYVFVHVEAPDEAGHMGSTEKKISAAEMIDSRMLPIITEGLKKFGEYRILLTPDHATPIETKTHSAEPVPAIICGSGVTPDANTLYTEKIQPSFNIIDGYKIADYFFNYSK